MPLPDRLRANRLNPAVLAANVPAFKRLLAHNPKAKIVWVHVGFEPLRTRGPRVVRDMLQDHPNLHMSFRINARAPFPAAALSPEGELKSQWVALVRDFPDRFMLGSDAFYAREGIARGSSEAGMNNLRSLVSQLPEDVALKVASENAIRLYRLEKLTR